MTDNARVLPQSLAAEMCLLGSMILDPKCIDALTVKKTDFFRSDHRIIFDVIVTLHNDTRAVDLVLLRDKLGGHALEAVGGVDYLVRLVESVPSADNAPHYSQVVCEKSRLRRLIQSSQEAIDEAYNSQEPAEIILGNAEQRLSDLTRDENKADTAAIGDIMAEAFHSIQNAGQAAMGPPTGYYEIDSIIGGCRPSDLIILAARPGMGKTSLALNIAENMAVAGYPIGFVSLEMTIEDLGLRVLSSRSGVSLSKIRRDYLSEQEAQTIENVLSELRAMPFYINDTPGMTPMQLRGKARMMHREHGIKALFVDYLQLLYLPKPENRTQEITQISRQLKVLARELKIPVIALSQLNRAVENRDKKQPRLADLRDSGAIEQDADIVFALHREDYYHQSDVNYTPDNIGTLAILKHRNGETTTIELGWKPEITRFESDSRPI